MVFKRQKLILALFLVVQIFYLLGCGSSDGTSKSGKRNSRPVKKVLTESEKEKYITPTIYFIADYSSDDQTQCSEKNEIRLRLNKNEIVSLNVCKKTMKGCALQGSCYIQYAGNKTLINYHKKVNGLVQFMIVDRKVCAHGFGDSSDKQQSFKQMCLDPFYTVAADTVLYPLGTVIYIPSMRGIALPSGSFHDGYFIVRDSGGDIKGRGRFDFFSGDFGLNANNPFFDLGLGGESNFEYLVVGEDEAKAVRERRQFPLVKLNATN